MRRASRKRKEVQMEINQSGGATGKREVQKEPEEQGTPGGKKRKREQV